MKRALVVSATLSILIFGIIFNSRLMGAAEKPEINYTDTASSSVLPLGPMSVSVTPDAYAGTGNVTVTIGAMPAEYAAGLALLTQVSASSVHFRLTVKNSFGYVLTTTTFFSNSTTGLAALQKNAAYIDSVLNKFKGQGLVVGIDIDNKPTRPI